MAKKMNQVKNQSTNGFEIKTGLLLVSLVLFFWVPLEDAMNLSKFTIALLLILPFALKNFNFNILNIREGRIITILLALLFSFAFISSILAKEILISLLGNHARLNGLLFYTIVGLFFLSILANFNFEYINKFLFVTLAGSSVVLLYSIIQFFEQDFVNWELAFNRIVGTLGNPDFNAAYLGFGGIIAIYFALTFNGIVRIASSILSLLFLLISYTTEAKQGPFVFFAGLAIFLFYRKKRNKKILFSGYFLAALITTLVGLAMLDEGPLAKYIYKVSITFRGDYWRAGWRMFTENPIFGVGFGRYGDYFREYRDVNQVVRRGSELTSDQPHNVFLDYLSTGGIFTFLIFAIIVLFIFFLASQNIRLSQDLNSRAQASLLLALYSAYTLQSFISIDHIALATFGWTIGALIVVQNSYLKYGKIQINRKINLANFVSPIAAFALGLVLVVPIWQADASVRFVNGLSSQLNFAANAEFVQSQTDILASINTIDPYYYQQAGISYLRFNKVNESVKMFQKALTLNSRDAVSMASLASIYMQTNRCKLSLTYSRKAVEMDPFNQTNLLDRMRCLVKVGELKEARIMLDRILEINPNNDVAKFGQSLL